MAQKGALIEFRSRLSTMQSVDVVKIVSRKALAAGVFPLFLYTHPQLALCGSLNRQPACDAQ